MDETLRLAIVIGRILEQLGADYFICGSLASSRHGVPRTTLDADLVTRLTPEHITLNPLSLSPARSGRSFLPNSRRSTRPFRKLRRTTKSPRRLPWLN